MSQWYDKNHRKPKGVWPPADKTDKSPIGPIGKPVAPTSPQGVGAIFTHQGVNVAEHDGVFSAQVGDRVLQSDSRKGIKSAIRKALGRTEGGEDHAG